VTHILDNPIWHALVTGNKKYALGSEHVKYIKRDVGLFAGLQSNSERELVELHKLLPSKSRVILFTPEAIRIPAGWNIELKKDLLQMVYQQRATAVVEDRELTPL
jgi:hypothetical protein